MRRYRIFNFDVESEIVLPCDESLASHPGLPSADFSIQIRWGEIPERTFQHARLIGRRNWGAAYDVGDGVFLSTFFGGTMHFPRDGNTIRVTFDLGNADQEKMMGFWMVNLGLGIYSLLRNQIPLHGASAEIDGQLVCLMADSGTGKSTLLWQLLHSGALFASDDQLPIRSEKERIVATPALTLHGKLSADALQKRGHDKNDFSEAVPNAGEFWMPMKAVERTFRPQAPAALIVLRPYITPAQQELHPSISICQHTGAAAVSLLMANTHSLWAVGDVIDTRALAMRYLNICHRVPVLTMHYERTMAMLPHVVQCVHEIARQAAQPSALAA